MNNTEFERIKRLYCSLPQYKRSPFDDDTWKTYEYILRGYEFRPVWDNAVRIVQVSPFLPSLDELLLGLVKKERDNSWMRPYIEIRDKWWKEIKCRDLKQ